MKHFLLRAMVATIAGVVLAALALSAWLAFTQAGQAARSQVQGRSPNELVRHLQRRLEGHGAPMAWLRAPLAFVQHRLEPPPPATDLPGLGKGQRREPFPLPPGLRREWRVDTPQAIREALLQAGPGTRIVVAPGLYAFDHRLRLGHDGTAAEPIALMAERAGQVWFQFAQDEGIVVDRPHWRFENLDIHGTCARHHDCEHAFHVIGRGTHVMIRNNRLHEFNAAIKVNGWQGDWPDDGVLAHNTLVNTAPRQTDRPVVMLDLVGAHRWQVLDNQVRGFAKGGGNFIAYGLFAKGASEGVRFERNLVVCSPADVSAPGARIGISFGGGATMPVSSCRDRACATHEHLGGIAVNNIVAHCNDVGIDANHGRALTIAHNTLINTAGIGVRRSSDARLLNNLFDGGPWVRADSRIEARGNQPLGDVWLPQDAAGLRWRPVQPHGVLDGLPEVPLDFHGLPRGGATRAGAIHAPD